MGDLHAAKLTRVPNASSARFLRRDGLKDLFWILSQSYGSLETSDVVADRYYNTHKKLPLKLCATIHPENWTEERVLRLLCPHPLSAEPATHYKCLR